ncbi:hypothetical protein C8Q79DRAFT_968077 [Trametes meyenii]|nr:hypothetical protein C8Q79DRAFT_968077 [Trametes meyenii]
MASVSLLNIDYNNELRHPFISMDIHSGKAPARNPEPHYEHNDVPTSENGRIYTDITYEDIDSAVAIAVALQREFDKENLLLEAQLAYLQHTQPKSFSCGICFDEYQEDHAVRVSPCGHAYCRECLTGYAASKIEDHRYPILCPQCAADGNREDAPSEIGNEVIQQLGLTERQYGIFVDMQMSMFSVAIDCRKCHKTPRVDKNEYEKSEVIRCPMKGCGYMWCKLCSQPVNPSGPKHSCDGTNELDHLLKAQKWKRCPGCKTPTEKTAGCHYMMCIAPGCNTHFCYLCGQLIVRSAMRKEISAAKVKHDAGCTRG